MNQANLRDHAAPPVDALTLGRAVLAILEGREDCGLEVVKVRDDDLGFAYWEAVTGDAVGVSPDSAGAALLNLAAKLEARPTVPIGVGYVSDAA